VDDPEGLEAIGLGGRRTICLRELNVITVLPADVISPPVELHALLRRGQTDT